MWMNESMSEKQLSLQQKAKDSQSPALFVTQFVWNISGWFIILFR